MYIFLVDFVFFIIRHNNESMLFLYKIEKKTNSIAVSSALRSSSHNLVAYLFNRN
jgi:hypothetical protein